MVRSGTQAPVEFRPIRASRPQPEQETSPPARREGADRHPGLRHAQRPLCPRIPRPGGKAGYSESDLESAIIGKLEHFLLELGKGFLFEARQKRFTFDDDHFFVDLVFYNRLLRCYVLVDLKLDKLTHQDLGQMQMYVNYFDRYVKTPEENPTIGILLCKRKKAAIVELTLPKDANIHASQYQLYLPSKEDLKQRLIEWTEEISDDS